MSPVRMILAVLTVIAGSFTWHASGGSAATVDEKSGVTATGINDRGQVVGTLTRDWLSRGYVWSNGSLKPIGLDETVAINERGEVLGYSIDTWGLTHSVLWENGRAKRLGLGFVWALNDHGQVLGFAAPPGVPRETSLALWTNGTTRSLPFDPDQVAAMNDRGQVVGVLPDGDAGEWEGGKITDLGAGRPIAINDRGEILGGGPNGDVTVWRDGIATDIGPGWPIALNNRGQVTGWYEVNSRSQHAFLWSDGTRTDLGGGYPTAISKSGQVVGYNFGRRGLQYGFVWQHGTMTRLPPPKGHAGSPTRAVAINDHNQIVGEDCETFSCDRNGGPHGFAVLWTLRGRKVQSLQIVGGRTTSTR
jgi:probable HAF family extracellular repeat protein